PRIISMKSLRAYLIFPLVVLLTLSVQATAQDSFVVEEIRLEGLQRISAGTIFNYLPVKVGDRVDSSRTAEAIRALFRTGFFRDITIEREGNTLVVFVTERPSISSIEFSGNKTIETEDLMKSLRDVGFAEGRVFNRSIFDSVEQELRRSYFSQGRYAVQITSTVTPLERNRVAVNFDISEGKVAKIKQINIVGNESFDDDELVDLFSLTTPNIFSIFTKSDQYSKQKLAADLEALRSFYLDRGYINFNIDSTQVSLTPDKQDVYITVNVTEGDLFSVSEVKLAGDLIVPQDELFKLVKIRAGDVFSRKLVTETSAEITDRLGEEGYAFANINAVPEIDDEKKQVQLTFFLDPGKRVYVRRIDFKGNTKTQDEVLRREMRQAEGGWISTPAIKRSKERLERLTYFEEVNIETPAVPGTTDQVDVDVTVKELPAGNLLIGAGFSQTQGVVLSTSVTQENFLGTGNRASFSFNNSEVNRNFGLGWFNPYWTDDGISRGFDAHYRKTNALDANLADYDLDQLGGGITFGVPISETNSVDFGLNYEHTEFIPGIDASTEVLAFERSSGGAFDTVSLTASWANDSRDSHLAPTRGKFSRLGAEVAVPGLDLTYYKVTARHQRFFPLVREFILVLDGEVGYGDGYGDTEDLPLINNFFAGGIRTVRGFEGNTLGPRDSRGRPLGGSTRLIGNAEVILPVPFARDLRSFRLTTFVDAGNVYGPGEDLDFGKLRYSAGVSAIWLSPLGPMTVSIAAPLNSESGDDTQPFQFTFGTSF
ncbi:MAG TPA: outer membrane protein assembly factor BamA, partial [Gammaproteobacteria bacterium]